MLIGLITLVTPVLALLLGQTLNGEQPGINVWLGTAIILAGLGLFLWGGRLYRVFVSIK
jgi:drug/metabolite transporter (DMT)-like permease